MVKEHTAGWQNKVTLVVKASVILIVIILFYIIRSINCTCKAVAQRKLSQNSENSIFILTSKFSKGHTQDLQV